MSQPFAEFDQTYRPLIAIQFNGAPRSEEEFNQFLQKLIDLYIPHERIRLLFDATRLGIVGATYIRDMINFMLSEDIIGYTQTYLERCALVIPNQTVQNVVNMILAVASPPVEINCLAGFDEGFLWLQDVNVFPA